MNQTVTAVITDYVNPNKIKEYENWVVRINTRMSLYKGFIALDITKPTQKNSFEYTIMFRFENSEKLKRWHNSKDFQQLLDEGKQYMKEAPKIHIVEGLEMLFDRSQRNKPFSSPPYYKQVIISIICVYPLILGINELLYLIPFMDKLPFPIFLFISVIFVSGLMAKPVMPFVTKLLVNWLYK